MSVDRPIPDAARQMLARFGSQIEYTDLAPNGYVNLSKSEVDNDDLPNLVYYPGFDRLNLNQTLISDAGLQIIGGMNDLEILESVRHIGFGYRFTKLVGANSIGTIESRLFPWMTFSWAAAGSGGKSKTKSDFE
jgi:hypothetical protein